MVIDVTEHVITFNKAEPGTTTTYMLTSDDFKNGVSIKENAVITVSFEESAD